MKPERFYGWPVRELPGGQRVSDAPRIVRWLEHHFWLRAFHWLPASWLVDRGLRASIGRIVIQHFGWWGYSHQDPKYPSE